MGDKIAFDRWTFNGASYMYSIIVYDLRHHTADTILSQPDGLGNAAWSPDGRELVFSRNQKGYGELWTVDLATGKLCQITHGPNNGDHAPAWSR